MPFRAMSVAGLLVLMLAAGPALSAGTPATAACPDALPPGTSCYSGQDTNGAQYLIAIPEGCDHVLVVHVRGGPYREHLGAKRSEEDATRWAIWLRQGYAYAASQYRARWVRCAAWPPKTPKICGSIS